MSKALWPMSTPAAFLPLACFGSSQELKSVDTENESQFPIISCVAICSMLKAIAPEHEMIPMDRLRAGETAEIVTVLGSAEQVHRLSELGLREGTEISVIQPGCPCIIRLAGQRLCFRSDELLKVLVRPIVMV